MLRNFLKPEFVVTCLFSQNGVFYSLHPRFFLLPGGLPKTPARTQFRVYWAAEHPWVRVLTALGLAVLSCEMGARRVPGALPRSLGQPPLSRDAAQVTSVTDHTGGLWDRGCWAGGNPEKTQTETETGNTLGFSVAMNSANGSYLDAVLGNTAVTRYRVWEHTVIPTLHFRAARLREAKLPASGPTASECESALDQLPGSLANPRPGRPRAGAQPPAAGTQRGDVVCFKDTF